MNNTPLARALADPRTQASFKRLDVHRASGQFDQAAAMRLLSNNARDHTDQDRQALAMRLFAAWQARHPATYAERAYFDGDHCAHVAAMLEHNRLAQRMRECHKATHNR